MADLRRARTGWRRSGVAGLALLVAGTGALELGLQGWVERRAPAAPAYDALVGPVRAMHQPGDLVVVRPAWAEPHVRRALGDDVFTPAVVGRADDDRFARAIEIVLPSGAELVPPGFRVTRAAEVGPFEVRLLENMDFIPPTFDFVERFGPRHVTARTAHPDRACAWRAGGKVVTGRLSGPPALPASRFECETLATSVSSTFVADERFEPRWCIYAPPPPEGERVVQFNGVALGGEIVGHTLVHWMASRERLGAPVVLTVRVDGEVVGSALHVDGDGWSPFRFDLTSHAGKPSALVEFVISADDPTRREFCFEAVSR